ncbi:hypothetical protein AUJ66_02160 [Candidatus Desantisbacteria bacterium CG1_02_38_46]|uniref:beta-N-acetylhexosaminidase n=2 Tax=unclassified Candidatus Desantisiibacteriota TaxID=3106372 RepID=A0A2H9PD05_9BACT|nr:MAG: hypothetical protein AUJ66_02160 [Candidatus Desantisbacteria bacterium CG1_02_38_46]PIZ17298.1 MAG: hypothetical protein COY51_00605 [Candidatus Desantisbacteria bacterium CG_4_10_14_0_8_um_filter_39_17]
MLYLLPQVKKMEEKGGIFVLDPSCIYWREENEEMLLIAVEKLKEVLSAGWRYARISKNEKIEKGIEIKWNSLKIKGDEEYLLDISKERISIEAKTIKGAYYGIQTLIQIIEQKGYIIPCLKINDYPTYKVRGIHYDISQPAMVPKLKELYTLIDLISHFKINHLQLYMEHTFSYRNHPLIGYNASPLTAEDILKLDSYAKARGVELVPAIPSLGHMSDILCHYPYLSEDLGKGEYKDKSIFNPHPRERGWLEWLFGKGGLEQAWTISPSHPQAYSFIESLYSEILPLFSSNLFNVCCDEAVDLGKGQTYNLVQEKGEGRVRFEHLLKLREIAKKYGKRIMAWADIFLPYHHSKQFYKEFLSKIPKDIILLNWDYSREGSRFKYNKELKEAGLEYYVCPSTWSWGTFFPFTQLSFDNILGFARSGLENKASGFLNTQWADGAVSFFENSWYGILCGADISWNTEYEGKELPERFSVCFFKDKSEEVGKATVLLGETAETMNKWGVLPARLFFSSLEEIKDIYKIKIEEAEKVIENCKESLNIVKKVKIKENYKKEVLKYYEFASQIQIHLAKKVLFLIKNKLNKENISLLLKEVIDLRQRFEELWLEKYKKGELDTMVLPAFDHIINYYKTRKNQI